MFWMSLIKRQAVNGAQTGSGLGQFRGKLSRLSRARRIDLDVVPSPGLKFRGKKKKNHKGWSQPKTGCCIWWSPILVVELSKLTWDPSPLKKNSLCSETSHLEYCYFQVSIKPQNQLESNFWSERACLNLSSNLRTNPETSNQLKSKSSQENWKIQQSAQCSLYG